MCRPVILDICDLDKTLLNNNTHKSLNSVMVISFQVLYKDLRLGGRRGKYFRGVGISSVHDVLKYGYCHKQLIVVPW